jgi:hypothetical protein
MQECEFAQAIVILSHALLLSSNEVKAAYYSSSRGDGEAKEDSSNGIVDTDKFIHLLRVFEYVPALEESRISCCDFSWQHLLYENAVQVLLYPIGPCCLKRFLKFSHMQSFTTSHCVTI